jgi:glyoxylase-like metal-dependent hydrolase (beta-lactamase superfamily II)
VGKITIRALHTPGHTMDTTYLLIDEMERACSFSGDTLFMAVEPDLAQSRFDDARTVSRNIQFVKNKNNDFAR